MRCAGCAGRNDVRSMLHAHVLWCMLPELAPAEPLHVREGNGITTHLKNQDSRDRGDGIQLRDFGDTLRFHLRTKGSTREKCKGQPNAVYGRRLLLAVPTPTCENAILACSCASAATTASICLHDIIHSARKYKTSGVAPHRLIWASSAERDSRTLTCHRHSSEHTEHTAVARLLHQRTKWGAWDHSCAGTGCQGNKNHDPRLSRRCSRSCETVEWTAPESRCRRRPRAYEFCDKDAVVGDEIGRRGAPE